MTVKSNTKSKLIKKKYIKKRYGQIVKQKDAQKKKETIQQNETSLNVVVL